MKLRLIGDIHGDYDTYDNIIANCDRSVQIGDMGFNYAHLQYAVDSKSHRFFPGNHDNFLKLLSVPHNLGMWGEMIVGDTKLFWLGGGYSIDKSNRVEGRDWFSDEELPFYLLQDVYEAWLQSDANILLSHEAPPGIPQQMGILGIHQSKIPFNIHSTTSQTLGLMIAGRKPKKHYFGHWHNMRSKKIDGVKYYCIGTGCYIDIEV